MCGFVQVSLVHINKILKYRLEEYNKIFHIIINIRKTPKLTSQLIPITKEHYSKLFEARQTLITMKN